MSGQIAGLIGLYGGAILGLLGWYYGRKLAKKQRGLDETHDHIWKKARSYSWYVTLFTIYILFSLYLFDITFSVPFALSMLILAQLASWALIGSFFTTLMYSETEIKISSFAIGMVIIIVSALLFLVLSLLTNSWLYLLISLPFVIIGFLFIKDSKEKQSQN